MTDETRPLSAERLAEIREAHAEDMAAGNRWCGDILMRAAIDDLLREVARLTAALRTVTEAGQVEARERDRWRRRAMLMLAQSRRERALGRAYEQRAESWHDAHGRLSVERDAAVARAEKAENERSRHRWQEGAMAEEAKRLRSELDAAVARAESAEARYEASQRMLAEVMGELRQVCEILGGSEFEKPGIDLATEVWQRAEATESALCDCQMGWAQDKAVIVSHEGYIARLETALGCILAKSEDRQACEIAHEALHASPAEKGVSDA